MARYRGSSSDGDTSVRVLLADDNPSMLQAARRILEPEFQVVGTVNAGEALLEAADALRPDVFILDISMGILNLMSSYSIFPWAC
jgi:CheY-like chemotaxis protein